MPLAAALLCDAATVRDGLLNVLAGGITRLWRESLPSAMNAALALMIELEYETVLLPHEVHVRIEGPAGELVGEVMGAFQLSDPGRLEAGEDHPLAQVIPLYDLTVSAYGAHRIAIAVDGEDARPLRFWVLHPEELEIPPYRAGTN